MSRAPLARARGRLEAARLLQGAGFHSDAAARAYYAAFYAAQAALESIGVSPKTHSGTLTGVNGHLVRPGHLPAEAARHLRYLFDLRHIADYDAGEGIEEEDGARALASAAAFIAAIERWLDAPPPTGSAT